MWGEQSSPIRLEKGAGTERGAGTQASCRSHPSFRREPELGALIRKLSTGDIIVFDDSNKELYIIDAQHASDFDDNKIEDVLSAARSSAEAGTARHFDSSAILTLREVFEDVKVLV
jgi:hypothetical protein